MLRNILLTILGLGLIAAACDSSSGGDTTSTSSSGSSSSSGSNSSSSGEGGAGGQGMGGTGGSAGMGAGGSGGSPGCRTGTDCGGANFCSAYTLAPLCNGMPDTSFDPVCTTDSDCPNMNEICDSALCIVPHGGAQTPPHCRAGCTTNADCGPGFACSATHHCDAAACTIDADCGSGNFMCAAGQCSRKACTMDSECANFCVNGSCWANLGECKPAVP